MHFLYSLGVTLTLVVGLPFWLWQIVAKRKYRAGLAERLGRVPARLRATAVNENCVWIHAVSVGEVLAVHRLIARFKQKFPDWRVAVSTTTLTGQTLARQRFGTEHVFYLPLDLQIFLRPFFHHLRPRMLVMAESEFWPNLLAVATMSRCRVAVVNARVSDRSFPRYRRFTALLAKYVFAKIDLVLAQSQLDADRLVAIGAPAGRVQVSGNVKFDQQAPKESELVRSLRDSIAAGTKVVVCGSTVEGEEQVLVPALQRFCAAGVVTILAPRHPERFAAVAALLAQAGIPLIRRSSFAGKEHLAGQVFLLDSIGELAAVYALADVAFVGGSLVPLGGHNILEPAYFGKTIVVGPHMENFRDTIRRFEAADAVVVTIAELFSETIGALLRDEPRRSELGRRAAEVLQQNAGATERTLSALEVLLWMPETVRGRMAVRS